MDEAPPRAEEQPDDKALGAWEAYAFAPPQRMAADAPHHDPFEAELPTGPSILGPTMSTVPRSRPPTSRSTASGPAPSTARSGAPSARKISARASSATCPSSRHSGRSQSTSHSRPGSRASSRPGSRASSRPGSAAAVSRPGSAAAVSRPGSALPGAAHEESRGMPSQRSTSRTRSSARGSYTEEPGMQSERSERMSARSRPRSGMAPIVTLGMQVTGRTAASTTRTAASTARTVAPIHLESQGESAGGAPQPRRVPSQGSQASCAVPSAREESAPGASSRSRLGLTLQPPSARSSGPPMRTGVSKPSARLTAANLRKHTSECGDSSHGGSHDSHSLARFKALDACRKAEALLAPDPYGDSSQLSQRLQEEADEVPLFPDQVQPKPRVMVQPLKLPLAR